jgi:uncharacterized protein (TIGR02271 family)
MAYNTVVAVFDNEAEAQRAVADLATAGIARDRIDVTSDTHAGATATAGAESRTNYTHEHEGLGERISHFFSRLFGGDDTHDDATYYSEAFRRGSAVVTVDAENEAEADRAADILDRCGAVNIDERANTWRETGWAGSPARPASSDAAMAGSDATAFRRETGLDRETRDTKLDRGVAPDAGRSDERVIPVVNEELQVGKRRRDRGGVRIYTHMSERPVEEQVRLREEHARVERRPADRPATEADMAAFKDSTIEVRETVEEPVVAKQARVVEEVVVGKEVSERVESVNDVVRKGEVDVEQLGTNRTTGTMTGSAPRTGTYDDYAADFRNDWQTNYSRAGGRYEDYEPAYRYGTTLASDERYRNRNWNDIEADARRDWETRYPGSTWERFKAAVRHGWDRMTGQR